MKTRCRYCGNDTYIDSYGVEQAFCKYHYQYIKNDKNLKCHRFLSWQHLYELGCNDDFISYLKKNNIIKKKKKRKIKEFKKNKID